MGTRDTNDTGGAMHDARAAMAQYDALDPEQHVQLGLPHREALRRAAFTEAAAELEASHPKLADWAQAMVNKYGPHAKVWHNVVSWTVAFLVGRYGEAVEKWPQQLSEADAERMEQWHGSVTELPNGVQPLGPVTNARTNHPRALLLGLDEARAAAPQVDVAGQDETNGQNAPAFVAAGGPTDGQVAP